MPRLTPKVPVNPSPFYVPPVYRPPKRFLFKLPSLPKSIYDIVKRLQDDLPASQWTIVCLGIMVLDELIQQGEMEAIQARMANFTTAHPIPEAAKTPHDD